MNREGRRVVIRSSGPALRVRILTALLLLPAALHLAAAAITAAPDARIADWLAHYDVTFGRSAKGVPTARVAAELLWNGNAENRPATVEVDMADDGFPNGYGSYLHDFQAAAPGASAGQVSLSLGRYRLPVARDGSTGFRYTVVMEHDPAGWGPGPDEGPYRFDGGAFWTGRALFVTAPDSRTEVRFRAAKGEKVSVSFDPIQERKGAYLVLDPSRLRNSFLIVGRHSEARLRVGDAFVTLALGPKLAGFMPSLERSVSQFMEASSAIFGGAPPSRSLIVGNLGAPPGSLFGGTFADDVSFMVDGPLGDANADRWRPFLVHEIFHLWNGNAIRFDAGQQYWFSEGVTEYYGHLLPVRTGLETGEQFLETVRGKSAAYLGAAGSMSLLAAGNEKFLNYDLVYQGGSLAALVLDLKIRHASSNQASLDDVMKRLYRTATARADATGNELDDGGLTLEEIQRTVGEVAGRPMDDFFERHVVGNELLPLEESFALAGLTLRARVADLPELSTIAGELLPVPSMTIVREGLQVNRTSTQRIQPGDIIVGVAGATVRTFDDLRWALRGATPGGACDITVLREKSEVDLTVRLLGTAGDTIPSSRAASVTLDLAAEAEPAALAIRQALLGGATGSNDAGS